MVVEYHSTMSNFILEASLKDSLSNCIATLSSAEDQGQNFGPTATIAS